MILNFEQLRKITLGAVEMAEDEQGIHFHRFTKEQREIYEKRGLNAKVRSTSGVQLRFRTDSNYLALAVCTTPGTTRTYFAFDVLVNGVRIGTLDNFSHVELPQNYPPVELPLGEYSKQFDLGEGMKEVRIVFPWSVIAVLQKLELDDGAVIEPVKPEKKLLCFGDSITHGYDALYPANKYASLLADFLGAEEFNKAIGGERFWPELAQTKENFQPDYITVAYGTNDWSGCTAEVLTANCEAFYRNLATTYPNVPIYAITPIWRKGSDVSNQCGPFTIVEETIRKATAPFENITVISAIDFVPHDENYFADLRLHPNDKGFAPYFECLSQAITERRAL